MRLLGACVDYHPGWYSLRITAEMFSMPTSFGTYGATFSGCGALSTPQRTCPIFLASDGLGQKTTPSYFMTSLAAACSLALTLSISEMEYITIPP